MPKTKAMCAGCHQDFYNKNVEGGCWMWKTSKITTKMRVGIWQNPPYEWSPQKFLSCYQPEGYALIEKNDCRVVLKKKKSNVD